MIVGSPSWVAINKTPQVLFFPPTSRVSGGQRESGGVCEKEDCSWWSRWLSAGQLLCCFWGCQAAPVNGAAGGMKCPWNGSQYRCGKFVKIACRNETLRPTMTECNSTVRTSQRSTCRDNREGIRSSFGKYSWLLSRETYVHAKPFRREKLYL